MHKVSILSFSLILFVTAGFLNALQAQDAQPHKPAAYDAAIKINYVRVWDVQAPITDATTLAIKPLHDVKQTTQFIDGLGRPLQVVAKKASLVTNTTDPSSSANAVDLVTVVNYDEYGREIRKYLPFASNQINGVTGGNSDGYLKSNPFDQQKNFYETQLSAQNETFYYSKIEHEASPLGRPERVYAAGNSWVHDGNGTKIMYDINTINDAVRKWTVNEAPGTFASYSSALYEAGDLFKTVTEDENGKKIIEYKDQQGRIILKKVQLDVSPGADHTGWLCTYYIYDELNRLRAVIQPEGVKTLAANAWDMNYSNGILLQEQCFRYEYDERGRMITKKVPGAGSVQMIYDTRDRLVMTQDANMQAQQKWLVTTYDNNNNLPVATYLITDPSYFGNPAHHRNLAGTSTSYPDVNSYNKELLTQAFYDNYDWLGGTTGHSFGADRSTADDGYFMAPTNSSYPYPQPINQSFSISGLVTGTKVKILGEDKYLYAINYYDEKGRIIQVQRQNYSGGIDIATTQYSYSGKALLFVTRHEKKGVNAATQIIATRNNYDDLGRITSIEKNLNNTGWKVIANTEYDALGQIKKEKIGRKKDINGEPTTDALEELTHDYNIRGWVLGVNRDYAKTAGSTSNYFGYDLGYDKVSIKPEAPGASPIGSFGAQQYNGNIAGTVWKSKGDGEIRKYDFTYDAANRLKAATFKQCTAPSAWSNSVFDFSVSNLSYDDNGNIKTMDQMGLKGTGSSSIDQLIYSYIPYTNRLQTITDGANDNTSKLGDFKYNTGTKTATDYGYDNNGNIIRDANKNITAIAYNHLNLPASVTITVKESIEYTYDATGNKLKKTVHENNLPDKTTLYLFGTYENDQLQFLPMEEGRIRPVRDGNGAITSFTYDYFIKDHLGNVRMVLTEEQHQDIYPAATLENVSHNNGTAISAEDDFYNIDPSKVVNKDVAAGIPDYPNNNGIYNTNYYSNTGANSARLYQLNASGNTPGDKTGLGITIKVMAGDAINIFGKSYHKMPTAGYTSPVNAIILSELINGLAGTSIISSKGVTGSQITAQPGFPTSLNQLIGNQPDQTPDRPKAGINWIILDEQFKWVAGGFDMVGAAVNPNGTFKTHDNTTIPTINIPKNGYIYVYCNNESQYNVFFDNLQVIHNKGPLLEETHYYPFGLTMAGISSKAAGTPTNKYKYNGKEEQRNEFSDGSGLELYDFGARLHDPQIGRWTTIDPLAQKRYWATPYNFVQNNPINRFDPNGLTDYTLDKTTGEVKQVGEKNDDPDRILKTNQKGEVKYKKNGEAKVAIDGIEQGILKDGMNFQKNDYMIAVGGNGQATEKGVEAFALKLSGYVGKEIGGAYYSKDGEASTTHVTIGRYKDNDLTTTKANGNNLWTYFHGSDETNQYTLRGFFHTHPSANVNVDDRVVPSDQDLSVRDSDHKLDPNLKYYILTDPLSYGNPYPYKIDYTTGFSYRLR